MELLHGLHTRVFKDRQDAGRKLARVIFAHQYPNPIVLTLPRGGTAVGYEIARKISAQLDVFIVRKISAPFNHELGLGALTEFGDVYFDKKLLTMTGINANDLQPAVDLERIELNRRLKVYRNGHTLPDLKSKTVILVDDGVATGVSAIASINSLRSERIKFLVFATPVCPIDSAKKISQMTDEFICLEKPVSFNAIGDFYENFEQVTDRQVLMYLKKSEKKV